MLVARSSLLVARFIQINLQWGKIQPGGLLVAPYSLLVARCSLKRKSFNEKRGTSNRFNPQSENSLDAYFHIQ
jgi:hypothetical protein